MALVLGLASFSSPAFAHTDEFLSTPENGSTVSTVDVLSFTFSEALLVDPNQPEYAPEVALTNSEGVSVELGEPSFDVTGATMTVPIVSGALPDGEYVAAYRVTSIDSHPVTGSFSFTVAGSAAPALPATEGGAEAVTTDANVMMPEPRDLSNIGQPDPTVITLSVIMSLAGTVLLVWAVVVVIRRRKK